MVECLFDQYRVLAVDHCLCPRQERNGSSNIINRFTPPLLHVLFHHLYQNVDSGFRQRTGPVLQCNHLEIDSLPLAQILEKIELGVRLKFDRVRLGLVHKDKVREGGPVDSNQKLGIPEEFQLFPKGECLEPDQVDTVDALNIVHQSCL